MVVVQPWILAKFCKKIHSKWAEKFKKKVKIAKVTTQVATQIFEIHRK